MNLTTEVRGRGSFLGSQATNPKNILTHSILVTVVAVLVVIIILGGSA